MYKKLVAFTLAEILVVLLILGVVASLTIPALIQDSQEAELKTVFKKHFAEISVAYNSLVQDNGGSLKGVYNGTNEFANAFKDKFNYLKYCPVGTASECIPYISRYKYLDATTGSHPSGCEIDLLRRQIDVGTWASIILQDGSVITIVVWNKECNVSDSYVSNSCTASFQSINIDVNGEKPPNVLGKDLFIIMPYATVVKPAGISANMSPYTGNYASCSVSSCRTTSSGFGCAAKVLGE